MKLLNLLHSQIENDKVGTLSLAEATRFAEIFFERGAAFLSVDAYSGKIDASGLDASGLLDGKLSMEDLDGALASADLTRQILPQILVAQGWIDDKQFQQLATNHVREEIVELLLRHRDSFHYQQGKVPEQLIKSEGFAGRIAVPVAEIISELEQRLETMKSLKVLLPSLEEVFVVTAEGMAHKQSHAADFALQKFLDLIDGFRDLRSLLDSVPFFEHFALCTIRDCLEQGFVKKTVLPEIKGVSMSRLSPDQARQYLPLFRNAVKYAVDELEARERLALVHEKLHNIDEAVVQYNFIGDALYRRQKPANAIKAYHRALTLKPGEVLVSDKIARIYQDAGEREFQKGDIQQATDLFKNALRVRPDCPEVFDRLIEIQTDKQHIRELSELLDSVTAYAKKHHRPEVAVEACRKILARVPEQVVFQKKLVNACLDFGDQAQAARVMATLAENYLEKGQTGRALEVLEKIKRLGGKLEPILERTYRELRKQTTEPEETGRRSNVLAILALGLLFAVVAYQTWSYTAWSHIAKASTAHAATTENAGAREGNPLRPDPVEVHNQKIAAECTEFLSKFPISLFRAQAEDLQRQSENRALQLSRERARLKRKLLADASLYSTEGNRAQVLATLAPLLELPDGDAWREEAEALVSALKDVEKSAQQLFNDGKAFEAAGKWRQAYRSYKQLLETFPKSQLGTDLRLPVLIESLPSGVEVYQRGVGGKKTRLGSTPQVIHMTAGEMVAIELVADGYYEYGTTLHESDGRSDRLVLVRKALGSVSLDGALAADPVFVGRRAICASDDGGLQAIDLRARRIVWRHSRESPHNVKYAPLSTTEGLYLVWNDGRVELLDPRNGEVKGSVSLEGLAASLPVALETGNVVIATSRHVLQSIRRGSLELLQGRAIDQLPLSLRTPPVALAQLSANVVLLVNQAGNAVGFDDATGTVLWRTNLPELTDRPPRLVGSRLVLVNRDNDLLLVSPKDGRWKIQPMGPGHKLAFRPQQEHVFWLDRGGVLKSFHVETGKVRASSLAFKSASLHPLAGRVAVVHDEQKSLMLVDSTTLEPLWATKAVSTIERVASNDEFLILAVREGQFTRMLIHARD